MKWILGAATLILAVLPASAGAPQGCAWLCGSWVLDATLSEPAEPVVDAALKTYKEPRRRSSPREQPVPVAPDGKAAASSAEPARDALREQLLSAMESPASLQFGEQADAILIRSASGEQRRAYPGEPHSRVTARGTTNISTNWRKDALIVEESQGSRGSTTETYALLPDGKLQLTRVVQRPDLRKLQLRAIYRRGQAPELESGSQERPQDSAR